MFLFFGGLEKSHSCKWEADRRKVAVNSSRIAAEIDRWDSNWEPQILDVKKPRFGAQGGEDRYGKAPKILPGGA